jgi:hypothetical protein
MSLHDSLGILLGMFLGHAATYAWLNSRLSYLLTAGAGIFVGLIVSQLL